MQSTEEFEYSIEKCFERESDGCFVRDDPRGDAIKLIADRDAEWQARVDTLLEDNARSEEQVKKQFATAVSFKARAEKAEARVEKLEAALKVAEEAMSERRGYAEMWEYKYGETWDAEDAQVRAALGREA